MQFPFVGLRTVKTALAVIISALLMKYVVGDTPFFACIGAAVAVERTMSASLRAAVIRNIGTLFGGVLGILFASLTQNPILLGLGVIPVILLHNVTNKKESIIPGLIVYFAVVYYNTGDVALSYGVRRIVETFIGSLIGLAVNALVFPVRAAREDKDRIVGEDEYAANRSGQEDSI